MRVKFRIIKFFEKLFCNHKWIGEIEDGTWCDVYWHCGKCGKYK